jgi:hypothetical protein
LGGEASLFLRPATNPIVLAGIDDPKTGAVAWVVIGSWDEIPDGRRW